MSIFHNCRCSLCRAYAKIHLIDKCLIIIMFLLLTQSSYSLFSPPAASSEVNTIDIIVRTATASIFGYFLSSNFMRNASNKPTKKNTDLEISSIDFDDTDNFENKTKASNQDSSEPYTNNHLQIIITTAIAIFCLFMLTIVRNSFGTAGDPFTASAQATISQFRDLISGCIGFLIGVPTTKK